MTKWTIDEAREHYNIKGWGAGYFDINSKGNIVVRPNNKSVHHIDLKELVDDIQSKGYSLPVLIRFSDILKASIANLSNSFQNAINEYGFEGRYNGVYPIKVNQQRQVVEEIVKFGQPYNIGLEAGSKPELHAILAILDNPEALLVCNGYKDEAFIRLALMSQKLGKKVFIVVEKLDELALIEKVAGELGVRPNIGLRIKLVSAGQGRWSSSAGEHSKFGLNSIELMEALEIAKDKNILDCVKLIHFHLGSQITNIRRIKDSLKEVGRFYSELMKFGCNIQYIDVGGGLGVDYDGSRSTFASSTNYSVQEYANDVVYHLLETCQAENLPHPNIISESGRAMTAHHSILVVNVLDVTSFPEWSDQIEVPDDAPPVLKEIFHVLDSTSNKNLIESWHDAVHLKDEAQNQFLVGLINLNDRALAERIYWGICRKIEKLGSRLKFLPEDIRSLKTKLADKYFCNFSVFQSVPDSWAIDQVFPVVPLHRLNEEPDRDATLEDITCDSDGRIDTFIGNHRGTENTLRVHSLQPGENYPLCIFLTGAYQEILGDLHNLFGDTNTVHVSLNEDGSLNYEQIIEGEDVTDVLDYVQFSASELAGRIDGFLIGCVQRGVVTQKEADDFLNLYKAGLNGYTYLVKPETIEKD
ncbi:MAG: biosynthetic arginine decarboxylase [Nitrospina sp.]|jgi:arginine decarboxylase|nr:biosynthetic arginine decarboxylase [Nitrospina sp.]MBT3876390.1 biosynthetic arginine decarboxylase [Nitrospina sp.]MBT4049713.1 biosynthetic arginine decarboxylase [Nitrospina sp.]MBT4558805.1 biosynthetic arginine decarboxylase [Nitrospina sp.]MBT5349603.1 biosynthetic arginine decarboxylase [Nitrospina sp.]